MFSINQQAVKIVTENIIPFSEQLNCKVHHLNNGATVVDMGVEARGGWLAGKLFVEATIGGMGHVDFGQFRLGKLTLPSIDVYIENRHENTDFLTPAYVKRRFADRFDGYHLTVGR
jgi:methenyltetrahydromethanopterin cyclohydrolase